MFSILFSFFRHFFSLAYSRDINPRDVVRHRPRAISLHIYPWMGSCIFHPRDVVRHRPRVDISLNFLEISTQETSWDIDRRKISRHIYPGFGLLKFLQTSSFFGLLSWNQQKNEYLIKFWILRYFTKMLDKWISWNGYGCSLYYNQKV